MSIELNKSMFTMEEAIDYGLALLAANGGKGRANVRPENGVLVVTVVEN